jgi:DNA-binding NarL/FixJ family response regulator
VRVFIINDHRVFVEALDRLLEEQPWLESVGSMEAELELIPELRAARPDVVLADLGRRKIGVADFVTALRLAAPEARIILLSLFPDVDEDQAALAAGADAFVAKENTPEELLAIIRRVTGMP